MRSRPRGFGQWFWAIGLGAGVVCFAGFALGSLVWAITAHDWSRLKGVAFGALAAGQAWGLLDRRLRGGVPRRDPFLVGMGIENRPPD